MGGWPQQAYTSTMSLINIATYNIHKGFSQFNRRMVVHELRDRLRSLNSDIVFLQEVQGLHIGHGQRFQSWPAQPQHEFLAHAVWSDIAYGSNAIYEHGHHGNAILSRYPIVSRANQDISGHRFERRGALLAQVDEVLAQNPGNTMERAVNVFDLPVLLRLEDGADETLVEDHGRSAALGDDHVADRSFAFSHN